MISLKQLKYALAVNKTRHFNKAADLCSVSQSTLSTAVAELESQLNVQIFERNTKSVFVTPIGELILERASNIKMQVDDLYALSKSQQTPLSSPLSMGVIPTIGPYLLPKVLPKLRKQYPQLKLTIVEEQSQVLVESVKSGELDVAILAMPYQLEGLHAFEFWQENFYSVFHCKAAEAKLDRITGEELSKSNLMLLKDGNCLKDHALATCNLQPNNLQGSLAGTSLHTLVQMVAGGMGVTIVPEMALPQLVTRNKEIKAVPINEPGPHRRLAFVTRLNYAGVDSIQILMELFRECLES